jgi:hypothetical protein
VQTGEFSIHWKPLKEDHARNLKVSKWFEQRSFSELKCMLESADKLHNLYGFIYAGMYHSDSLNGRYNALLSDTTSIQFQTSNGLLDSKMTVGEVLTRMYDQIIRDKQNLAKQPQVEQKVSSFIQSYSMYPSTYKSISFPYFSMGRDDKGLTNFSVRHLYQISNKAGKMVKVTSQFVLSPKLNINVIAQDSTSYIAAYPPMITDWLKEYGRQLSTADSVNLRLK